MKTAFGVLVAIIILAIIGVFGSRYIPKPIVADNTPLPSVATTTTPTVTNDTYTDDQYKFSIVHPSDMVSPEASFDGFLIKTKTPVVGFILPDSLYHGTNLAEAGIYVGATTSQKILTTCTAAAKDISEQSLGKETIQGVVFDKFSSQDAGAGNRYDATSYRVVKNGVCLEIVQLLHSGNIGNYEPGQVVEFDRPSIMSRLEAVTQTFKFIQ